MTDARPDRVAGPLSFGAEITIDDVHFRFDADGDLEVDIGTYARRDGAWDGHYFSREYAVQLRDWLNKVLP